MPAVICCSKQEGDGEAMVFQRAALNAAVETGAGHGDISIVAEF